MNRDVIENKKMDFLELLIIFRNRKWVILIIILCCFVSGLFYAYFMQQKIVIYNFLPVYQSEIDKYHPLNTEIDYLATIPENKSIVTEKITSNRLIKLFYSRLQDKSDLESILNQVLMSSDTDEGSNTTDNQVIKVLNLTKLNRYFLGEPDEKEIISSIELIIPLIDNFEMVAQKLFYSVNEYIRIEQLKRLNEHIDIIERNNKQCQYLDNVLNKDVSLNVFSLSDEVYSKDNEGDENISTFKVLKCMRLNDSRLVETISHSYLFDAKKFKAVEEPIISIKYKYFSPAKMVSIFIVIGFILGCLIAMLMDLIDKFRKYGLLK